VSQVIVNGGGAATLLEARTQGAPSRNHAMNTTIKSILLAVALSTSAAVSTTALAHPHRTADERPLAHHPQARARLARAAHRHPELALAIDLRRLEMLYRKTGQEARIVAMYEDLMQRTREPKLRAFAERRLKHAARVADPEASIAELRNRIDAKLAKLR
jgi:hypothetical protein